MSPAQTAPPVELQSPTPPETVRAVVAQSAAAASAWAGTPLRDRACVLTAVADALDAAADELIPLAISDTNLSEPRLRGELRRTTFQLRLFSSVLEDGAFLGVRVDHADPQWPMGAPRPDLRRMLIPVGPVVVFAASNFPFAFSVAGGDTAAALAAGCPVILKAHSGHLRLAEATVSVVTAALRDAHAPEGVFTAIAGVDAGKLAIQDPRVKAGAFTGSIHAGRALFDLAQSRPEPIPFYGELGSLNPTFITRTAADERRDELCDGLIASFTGSAGQLCTKPGVVLIPSDSDLIESLRTATLPGGSLLLNDRILDGYTDAVQSLAGDPSVEVLAGTIDPTVKAPTPTILKTTARYVLEGGSSVLDECFGPTTVVVSYDDDKEMLDIARSLVGQLTATIHGTDADELDDLVSTLVGKAGRILWNEWPTGVSVTYAQQHGGPYPATTTHSTSVGTAAIERFMRPVAFQNVPDRLLPPELREANPLAVPRMVDGSSKV
ncbi:aldehyde dehydrogenase (plasmid) [Rhodococcus erythropolis]|uniref:aldehyde dehydrogenase (NADP(+)) n=1 Tax=Rhodococcus erythropolis TaxID=1833 RepID=UPI00061B6F88|nr:aldehyde dehydrogenase (NADP(+)) [Rhodococcus erythropolis]AKE01088.1 aldehyde dehydrogenase [Rhodococcus erythropolis]